MKAKETVMKNVLPMVRTPAILAAGAVAAVLAWTAGTSGHCQLPCGIYDDPMRFEMLSEHIATIEKSTKEILELSKDPSKNASQLVRWVENRDHHADEFAEIVSYYFLQQRIEPIADSNQAAYSTYTGKLALCHRLMVAAMKSKQTNEGQPVSDLRKLLADFQKAYSPESTKTTGK
jgi:nickel superoxide dismutase